MVGAGDLDGTDTDADHRGHAQQDGQREHDGDPALGESPLRLHPGAGGPLSPRRTTASADRPGPTLDQLLPDPAQREVVRRTLSALDVLP